MSYRVRTESEQGDLSWKPTWKVGSIYGRPCDLAKALGQPTFFCDGETDREWFIADEYGQFWIVYAYKATSYYDRALPHPNDFWKGTDATLFSIGGTERVPPALYEWLNNRMKMHQAADALG